MIVNKNFDVVPGLPLSLDFDLLDDTFLKINASTFTFKFEVLRDDLTLKFISTLGFVGADGKVTGVLSPGDTMAIGPGLFQYRLVMKDSSLNSSVVGKGFLTCDEPAYVEAADPSSNLTVLPDGSVYAAGPTDIVFGTWYSISSYYRIVVTGVGTLALDLKNNVGAVVIADQRFANATDAASEWVPYMGQNTSFRLTQLAGNPTAKYLP